MKKLFFILALFTLCAASAQEKNIKASLEKIRVEYGEDDNQWMNIYPTGESGLNPVYIWAHPNSDGKKLPSADGVPGLMVKNLVEKGVVVISWESVPQVKSAQDVEQCQADLELLYKWLKKNHKKYGIDINNVFIGGASRGSVISWTFIHQNPDKVRGAYFTQALPKGAWTGFESGGASPLDVITAKSPKVLLAYRDGMDTDDGHSPVYGQRIVDKYKELKIGKRIELYDSMGGSTYKHLMKFINQNKK